MEVNKINRKISIHTTLHPDTYNYITRTAKDRNVTKNDIIQEAIDLHKKEKKALEIKQQNQILKELLYNYIKDIIETDPDIHKIIKNIK